MPGAPLPIASLIWACACLWPADGLAAGPPRARRLRQPPSGQPRPQAFLQNSSVATAPTQRAADACGLQLLTTFFTHKRDWQRDRYTQPDFGYMAAFYESAMRAGVNVTVLHDGLPEDLVAEHETPAVRFQQVDTASYDPVYGVNDVRFLAFGDVLRSHPEWEYVFNVDVSDVRVVANFCPELQPGRLYVGSETTDPEHPTIGSHPWMAERFRDLGAQYLQWYHENGDRRILNPGVMGGSRAVMAEAYVRMRAVITDPHLAARQQGKEVDVNLGALNYIVRNDFPFPMATGPPVHSRWKRYENTRRDVWFIHKF